MLLDIYLLRPESSHISCNILPGISDHYGVLLEVEWDVIYHEPQVEIVVPLYHKTCFRLAGLSSGKVYSVGWKW
jgi:hypothetical protein